jgi:hypothetical protein
MNAVGETNQWTEPARGHIDRAGTHTVQLNQVSHRVPAIVVNPRLAVSSLRRWFLMIHLQYLPHLIQTRPWASLKGAQTIL